MATRRKVMVKREPNGQPKREKTVASEQQTVIMQRIKHLGATPINARDQRFGTFFGRLSLANKITPEQFLAAEEFTRAQKLYYWVIGTNPNPPSLSLLKKYGGSLPSSDICSEYEDKYNAATYAMIEHSRLGKKAIQARDEVKLAADAAADFGGCSLPFLVDGLNSLVIHYKMK